MTNLSSETMEARKTVELHRVLESKKMPKQKYPTLLTFKTEGEIKAFSEKQEQKIHRSQNFHYKKS